VDNPVQVSSLLPSPVIENLPVDQQATNQPQVELPDAPQTSLLQSDKSESPTLRAVAIGEPGDQRFASGKVIIRTGDNLWTIARRLYGMGPRYVEIYQANRDQISDPHWIFPGQVFDLPDF